MNTLCDYAARLLSASGVCRVFMARPAHGPLATAVLRRLSQQTSVMPEETDAAHAAAGYSRIRQQTAAVIAEGNVLKLTQALRLQRENCNPVLYLSAQPAPPNAAIKFTRTFTRPEELANALEETVFYAATGRPGPVWLHFPPQMQTAREPHADPNATYEFLRPTLYKQLLPELLEALRRAARPLILAGRAVRLARAEREFENMLKTLRLPVVTTPGEMDLLDAQSPYLAGNAQQEKARRALQEADFILCLGGCQTTARAARAQNPSAFWASADIDDAVRRPDELFLHADLRDFLMDLHALGPNPAPRAGWLYTRTLWRPESPVRATQNAFSMESFIRAVSQRLTKNAVLCAEEHAWGNVLARTTAPREGQRILLHPGPGTAAAAAGACWATYRRKVICLESPQTAPQTYSLPSAARLPIKLFVPTYTNDKIEYTPAIQTIGPHAAQTMPEQLDAVLRTPGPAVCVIYLQREENKE